MTAATDRSTMRVVTPLLATAIVLVGANLRASITGVGSLAPAIEHDTGFDSVGIGLVGALPLLVFALTSPWVRRASDRLGSPRLLDLALVLVVAGTLVRSVPGVSWLFLGTAVLSVGIAVCNVLLPSVIKATVPDRDVGRLTGLYVTTMVVVAAVASGVAVPAADLPGGWRTSLGIWVVLPIAALAVCSLVRLGEPPRADRTHPARSTGSVWTSQLAWSVSLFMGLQSVVFYAMIAWLPSIVVAGGGAPGAAGLHLVVFQGAGLAASTAIPLLLRRLPDQRVLAVGASLLCAAGFGLLLLPAASWVAAVLVGFGGGACIVLALSFQSLRAPDPSTTAALAGMAQTVGYLVAAAAPLTLGVVRAGTGGWRVPVLLLVTSAVLQAVVGLRAGSRQVLPAQ